MKPIFVDLSQKGKNGKVSPIFLNVNQIIYGRRFNPEEDKDKKPSPAGQNGKEQERTAIFTPGKMLVVEESPSEVKEILKPFRLDYLITEKTS